MALFGAQLVITLIFASVIQKLSPHFSFARWVLCSTRLTRFLHPTDDELRSLAGIPKSKEKVGKGKDKRNDGKKYSNDVFHIPRNIDVQLETIDITHQDIVQLRYFNEYQWLIDFGFYSLLVYLISEIYHHFIPIKDEINLSVLWCLLMVFFALKLLASMTVLYFKSNESIGERSMCILAGFVYFLVAMIVLIVPESTLDVGLNTAFELFNQSASQFLIKQGISSQGPASKIVILFFLALFCGILGSLFTFPGLRVAKMHMDSLKYCKEKKFLKVLLNINFALPFILVLLWIKPISRDYLTAHKFSGMTQSIMSTEFFEFCRILAISVAVLLRMILMPIYLQAYLNLAYDRIEDQKKEAGRITNVEYKQKISSIFYYLCVVVLQYTAPILLCLFLSFIYKSLGEYSPFKKWAPLNESSDVCNIDSTSEMDDFNEPLISSIGRSVGNFHTSLSCLKEIFSTEVYRGIFGFIVFWTCFVWFSSTSLGMFYETYFARKV